MAKASDPHRKSSQESGRAARHDRSSGAAYEIYRRASQPPVSGRWLVKAMVATIGAAAIALYLSVCLLFYQGQWQFAFSRPSSKVDAPAAAAASGLPIRDHRFDYTEEGISRLDGWWMPAEDAGIQPTAPARAFSSLVVLVCPNGHSDLEGNLALFRVLHGMGASVFAFDYRGFGASEPGHPSQQKAYEDGAAALRYLTATRKINPGRIVLYGAEVGAAVAAHVAEDSPEIAGIILENPQPSLTKQVRREQHIHLLPMWLVFPDRFDISRMVPRLKMPKLILSTAAKPEYAPGAAEIFAEAAAPKQKVQLGAAVAGPPYADAAWQNAVKNFFLSLPAHSQ